MAKSFFLREGDFDTNIGKITKDDYFSKAKYHKKGDLDDDNKFRYKTNCYNVKISDLDTLYGSK